MSASISLEQIGFLAARAGLALTDAQKADLMQVYPVVMAMRDRIRATSRGIGAEPGHIFIPGEGITP